MNKCPMLKKTSLIFKSLFLLESVWEFYKSLLALAPREMAYKQSLDDWYEGGRSDGFD